MTTQSITQRLANPTRFMDLSARLLPWLWSAAAVLLIYEHSLVKPHDLSRVNVAFFTLNGWVSVLFFVLWAIDMKVSG